MDNSTSTNQPDGCRFCQGARWVCERHNGRPWGVQGGCDCGARGMPCQFCNPNSDLPPGLEPDSGILTMELVYRDRGLSGTQIDVICGDLVIAGRLQATLPSVVARQEYFGAGLFFVTAAPPGFEHHGTAASSEIACLAVERNWETWLAAAGLQAQITQGGADIAANDAGSKGKSIGPRSIRFSWRSGFDNRLSDLVSRKQF